MKYINILIFFTLLVSCNAGKDYTNIELVTNMMDQESIKAQDWDPKQPNKAMMSNPPEGTIPKGYKPYPFKNNLTAAETNLVNPLAGNFSPEIIELGKKNYKIYCGICHGDSGDGAGRVIDKMIRKPPSLIDAKLKAYKDGRFYHVIYEGFGMMNSYANQIPDDEAKWAVVNYIRNLQKSAN